MAILSAVGTLGVSQLQCIFKILFSSLLSHSLLSHSGRMNQGQDFSLLLGQGLGLKRKGLLSFQASFCSLLASSSLPLFKNSLFASSPKLEIGVSGPFPSFCNFLLMSGASWVMKEWANRTLPSIHFRSSWVKFLKASVSLPPKNLDFHTLPV